MKDYKKKYLKYKRKYLELLDKCGKTNNQNFKNLSDGLYFEKRYYNGIYELGGPAQKNFEAAGIVPYYIDQTGTSFLLSSINYNNTMGTWTFFGGKREYIDGSSSRQTAVREAYKESFDLGLNMKHLPVSSNLFEYELINNELKNGNFYVIPKLNKSSNAWNNIYFVKIDKNRWIVEHAHQDHYVFDNTYSYVFNYDIKAMKWFNMEEIMHLIDNKLLVSFLASIFTNYYNFMFNLN